MIRKMAIWKILLGITLLMGATVAGIFFMSFNEARQASFDLAVLQRYIRASFLVTGQRPKTLADLPDFDIISTADSLELKAKDIRGGIYKGYLYDYRPLKHGHFMILASPVGLFAPHIAYAVRDHGYVREDLHAANTKKVSYDDIGKWPMIIYYREKIRTKKLPDYIRGGKS